LALIGIGLGLTGFIILANDARKAAGGAAGVLLAVLLVTAVSFAVWWWISWKLPHAEAPASALIPGALFMAIGVEILHALTIYWIGHLVARKSNTYGAVGIALAVLLWVYILGRIIVGSAGLNATLWHRRQGVHGAPDNAGPPIPS
jgi:membrane protein